uniref:Uncharacterized protein n=1 Tax=Arion vulgaris TaxID=1028688 RepID=A0A0B7BTB7_9EUPU
MKKSFTTSANCTNFRIPGWRIEQKYSPGVLIGNWSEDMNKFSDSKYKHNSTYRLDFQNTGGIHPDVMIRRKTKLGDEGKHADMLLRHHGDAYDNMLISLYDESYNGRWRENCLPPLRKFDNQTLKWLPERSDYPLKGDATNWGLKEQRQAKLLKRQQEMYFPEFESTYMGSYQDKPINVRQFPRFATSRHLSTTLLPSNNINSNLHLRGKPNLRMPEVLPEELRQVSL